jgi:phosphoribosylglycinamide formyltransferase-1
MRIGWLSTGRDQAACNLLSDIVGRARQDELELDVAAVFCDRERGESSESDRFLDLVQRLGYPTLTLSSAVSWQRAQGSGQDRRQWREEFHEQVQRLLGPYRLNVLVLAGYMLIVSPAMCRRYPGLNLHPALPQGPTGTWQQVVWQLLRENAEQSGAMIHLMTPELDRGPVVAFDSFSLRGPEWDPLWKQLHKKLKTQSLEEIVAAEGEAEPLFAAVRARGARREIPLLYQTIKQFALGKLQATGNGAVFSESARLPLDLTAQVDEDLAARP